MQAPHDQAEGTRERGAPADGADVDLDLLQCLRRHAVATPHARAIEADDRTLDYRTLAREVVALAQQLRAVGVGPETRVAISLPRGAGELVAMLAVLAAGGAYVPVVPTHPVERLRMILDDAAPAVLVAEADAPLAVGFGGRVLTPVSAAAPTHDDDLARLDVAAPPEQLAYVMFTSGSTGRPKGVEIPRGALTNFLHSMVRAPGLRRDDRVLAVTTIAFDIAALELFGPLMVGATTVIVSHEDTRDPRVLRRRLADDRITVLQATPASWRLLVEAGFEGHPGLRMLCGGEAMSSSLAAALLRGGGPLWNMYGPTETCVWSSIERVEPGAAITIGRAIARTEIEILDAAREPVVDGEKGEIAIGGAGLARGYHGREDLTAERFILRPRDGARMYLTGDVGRRGADGRLEWLGRIDHQLKIRGFRVEPSEIEAVLLGHDGVREVLVTALADPSDGVARELGDGGVRLCAWWVGEADESTVRAHAAARLPDYMTPSVWMHVAGFPLTPNGKIDRARLPLPQTVAAVAVASTDTPQARIAGIFAAVLGLPAVAPDRSFFELGGTSLLAAQALLRIDRELGCAVPVTWIFESPTAVALAARIAAPAEPVSAERPVVAWLRDGDRRTPIFCLFGLQLYQALADALPPGHAVAAVHVPRRYVPGREPRPTLYEMAAHYAEVVRAHQPRGPYRLLGLCYGGVVAFEAARLLEQAGESVQWVCIVDAVLPSAMRVDPLARARSYVEAAARFARDGDALRRWALRRLDRLRVRVPLLDGALRRARAAAGPSATAVAIDLPIDGAEVDAEVERFSAVPARVAAPIHVVRATREPWPRWLRIRPDQGWAPRTPEVRVLEVPADHRAVLQPPFVAEIAAALVPAG